MSKSEWLRASDLLNDVIERRNALREENGQGLFSAHRQAEAEILYEATKKITEMKDIEDKVLTIQSILLVLLNPHDGPRG